MLSCLELECWDVACVDDFLVLVDDAGLSNTNMFSSRCPKNDVKRRETDFKRRREHTPLAFFYPMLC